MCWSVQMCAFWFCNFRQIKSTPHCVRVEHSVECISAISDFVTFDIKKGQVQLQVTMWHKCHIGHCSWTWPDTVGCASLSLSILSLHAPSPCSLSIVPLHTISPLPYYSWDYPRSTKRKKVRQVVMVPYVGPLWIEICHHYILSKFFSFCRLWV